MRFTRVTVGYLEGVSEPADASEWTLRITMPGKFRLLQAGLQGFDGPVLMLVAGAIKNSTRRTRPSVKAPTTRPSLRP